MKDTFFPVVLIGAILAGVVFYYRASLPGIIPNFSARSGPVEPGPEIVVPPKDQKKQSSTKSQQVRKSAPQFLPGSQEPIPGSVVTVIVSDEPANGAVRRSFPIDSDIKPGMERSQIRDRFGNPDLEAATADRGSLIETYVYQRKAGSEMTLVRLKDGTVEPVVK